MKSSLNPKVTLVCFTCGARARRELVPISGCRGVHEAPSEPAMCPKGHGYMERDDLGWVMTNIGKPIIGGSVSEEGVQLGLDWPGDPDYRWTTRIASALQKCLAEGKITYYGMVERIGLWAPHAGADAPVYSFTSQDWDIVRNLRLSTNPRNVTSKPRKAQRAKNYTKRKLTRMRLIPKDFRTIANKLEITI